MVTATGKGGRAGDGLPRDGWKMTRRTFIGSSWSLWTRMKRRFCYRSAVTTGHWRGCPDYPSLRAPASSIRTSLHHAENLPEGLGPFTKNAKINVNTSTERALTQVSVGHWPSAAEPFIASKVLNSIDLQEPPPPSSVVFSCIIKLSSFRFRSRFLNVG